MKLLDWIRNRNRPESSVDSGFDPKAHGHKDWKGVFAEIRHDESLARLRNETGCEPPSAPIEAGKSATDPKPGDAGRQRESASPQQDRSGWNRER